MANKRMYALGSNRSVIRDLFDYGQEQAKIVGKDHVFDFSIGNPTVPAPDCVPEAVIDMEKTRTSLEINGYTAAAGDPSVRAGLADFMNKTYGANVKGSDFYMTCGASASLAITLHALIEEEGEEIIVNAPFFPEYTVFITSAGGKEVIVPADTEHFQLNLSALEASISEKTRAVLINSPNNPSGAVYSPETIEALGKLLAKKSSELGHTIYLISDEPYREIIYDGLPIVYVPKYYKNTVICYSYSKSLSLPGNRIGYILVPEECDKHDELYAAVCGAGRALGYVCAPNLFQKVVLACLGKTSDVSIYDVNRKLIYNGLKDLGYECVYPEGAFYLFVKAPDGNSVDFMERAKKLNILIVATDTFGCPGYVRVSYCVDPEMIKRSLPYFKKLMESYK